MSSSVYIPSSSGGGGSTPPTSTSIKTASYTIPVGKYAKVSAFFTGSGSGSAATYTQNSCTLNGVSVLWESFRINRQVNAQTVQFTFPSTAIGSAYLAMQTVINGSFGTNYTFNGYFFYSGTVANSFDFFSPIAGGEVFGISDSVNNNISKSVLVVFNQSIKEFNTCVPSGTVLSGTGTFSWKVEEYTI